MPKNVVNVKYRLRGERTASVQLIELPRPWPQCAARPILARWLNVRDENVIVLDVKVVKA